MGNKLSSETTRAFNALRLMFKTRATRIFAVIVLASFCLPGQGARADYSPMDKITGAFIYRVSQFVTWPDNAFSGSENSFRICIFGKDASSISEILTQEIGQTSIHQRNVVVVSLPTMLSAVEYFESGGSCHIFFVTGNSIGNVARLIELVEEKTTLMMGDALEFLEAGGLLSLVRKKDKLKLFVNGEKLKKSSLKFDSRLMLLVREK